MKIELTKEEFNLVFENNSLSGFIEFIDHNDYVLITSDFEGFQVLLDNLADLIAEKGINDEGELNHFGIRIEKIIDKITNKIL